jgi:tRNA (cytidine32/uridine32-2'-O)-methyltransferase
VAVVLVDTTDVVNIGGTVRAMGNTGFTGLRLVRPQRFNAWDVGGIAHYSQHIVDATTIHPSLADALADTHLVVGLTGKHHRDQRNARPFPDTLDQVAATAQDGGTVALVFGREDIGLTNADLDLCHLCTTVPTNPAYPSLNLAQAALLVLYGLFERGNGTRQVLRPPRRGAPRASTRQLQDLFADLERTLDAVEFLKTRSPVTTMRALRSTLARADLDAREAGLLRALFIEVRRYLHRRGVLADIGPMGAGKQPDGDTKL